MAFYEVVIEGRQGIDDMLNVIHYETSGTDPVDWTDVADQIRALINGNIVVFCGSWITWVGITVREDIVGGVGTFYPFTLGTLAGSNATPSQIAEIAMLVRKESNSLVRPTKGWAMQGGLVSEGADGLGVWEAAVRAAVDALWTAMLDFTTGGGSVLGMVIKARNPTAPNTQPYTAVNSITTAAVPRSLKGRRQGTGS
jgi:hypothetical protein